MFTTKIKITKYCAFCVLIVGIMLFATGCSSLVETFGKDYRMVDDFWEQIEADIDFSFNEYFSNQELTAEQKESLDNGLKQMSLYLRNEKKQMKTRIAGMDEYLEALDYSGSVSDFIEANLLEMRENIKQELETSTQGRITLKHTEVKRGLWGSIWHFIRNHWIISLIILGIIGMIYEKVQEIFSKKVEQ